VPPQDFHDLVNSVWQGSVDIHVHAAPDPVAARRYDAYEMAVAARDAGMRAVVFKSHEYPTVPVAYILNRLVTGFTVFGAISLDHEVGGLNPAALEASAKMGAAKVWMPTFAANYWSRRYYDKPGITIFDDKGGLVPVVHDILDLVEEYDMVLGTGHLSTEEQLALVRVARARELKTVVTHADMWLPVAVQVELAGLGAFIEHAAVGCMPASFGWSFEQVAEAVRAAGPAASILSTDLGQTDNPAPAEGLRMFIAAMLREGFSAAEVELMVKGNPKGLLGLE
jgi:hypothetical protein